MIGMPSAFALGIFSGKFILYFRDSGTPAGVPLSHFHGRRSCSAARDKREIINNSSAIDVQSAAEHIKNRFTVRFVWTSP